MTMIKLGKYCIFLLQKVLVIIFQERKKQIINLKQRDKKRYECAVLTKYVGNSWLIYVSRFEKSTLNNEELHQYRK